MATVTGYAARMYGRIGKLRATRGKRDDLAAVLLEGSRDMPGCLSYVVANDPEDLDALWITEVWDDLASHRASLGLSTVQAAIAKGRSWIVGFEDQVETIPVGRHGLAAPSSGTNRG